MTAEIPQWDVFEAAFRASPPGNPFTDVSFGATFRLGHRAVAVRGFYDGDDTFRVRFMPDTPGEWRYETSSDLEALNGLTGSFVCAPPLPNTHGPVQTTGTFHFAYADGTPYRPIGTTCYAWTHQEDALEEQTLRTLAQSPFNKIRMCVFPKDYDFNRNEPPRYPFEQSETGEWDFTRFHPAFFRHFETRVRQLRDLGIEADIILFHPYDRWGFARMPAEVDDRYLRYLIARLAAYRNVWWSLANEFDIMDSKTDTDWERIFRIIQQEDPCQHLRSIHNCVRWYDHGKPWVTHASVQHSDLYSVPRWRDQYRKPIVVDECCYEGDIHWLWGNLTAEQMVNRFWIGTVGGGYVGHGETYLHPEEVLWWSKGGVLHGGSPPRIAFLKQVLDAAPPGHLEPQKDRWDHRGAHIGEEYYLYYYARRQPAQDLYHLPETHAYQADILDVWNMTMTPVEGRFRGKFMLKLPGKPFTAVRFQRVAL